MSNERSTKSGNKQSQPETEPRKGRRNYTYIHSDRKKKKLLKALQENLGIVKYACQAVNISRKTFYEWLKDDPDFRTSVEMIDDDTGDYVEMKLIGAIRNNDIKAITFYAETKLKERGYYKKTQQDMTIKPDSTINVTLDL